MTASTALTAYLAWPGVSQVFAYSYTRKNFRTGGGDCETRYGITSLGLADASAACLLCLRRGHWAIENKSHWVRDVVFGEESAQVRCGAIPQGMCALRNAVLSVVRFSGYTCMAQATRYFAAHPTQALTLINGKNEN